MPIWGRLNTNFLIKIGFKELFLHFWAIIVKYIISGIIRTSILRYKNIRWRILLTISIYLRLKLRLNELESIGLFFFLKFFNDWYFNLFLLHSLIQLLESLFWIYLGKELLIRVKFDNRKSLNPFIFLLLLFHLGLFIEFIYIFFNIFLRLDWVSFCIELYIW
jgi:hypothetical protein